MFVSLGGIVDFVDLLGVYPSLFGVCPPSLAFTNYWRPLALGFIPLSGLYTFLPVFNPFFPRVCPFGWAQPLGLPPLAWEMGSSPCFGAKG